MKDYRDLQKRQQDTPGIDQILLLVHHLRLVFGPDDISGPIEIPVKEFCRLQILLADPDNVNSQMQGFMRFSDGEIKMNGVTLTCSQKY